MERNQDTHGTENDCKMKTNFTFQQSQIIKSATNRVNQILDAKYVKGNLKQITTKLKYRQTTFNL